MECKVKCLKKKKSTIRPSEVLFFFSFCVCMCVHVCALLWKSTTHYFALLFFCASRGATGSWTTASRVGLAGKRLVAPNMKKKKTARAKESKHVHLQKKKKESAASTQTHFHKKTQPSIQCYFVAATNVGKEKRRSLKRACASRLCVLLDSTFFPLSLAKLETVNWE